MAKPHKYSIDLKLTLAVSTEDDYEAQGFIEDFLQALQYVTSSDDPKDDHYRILASQFYWLSFTDHGEIAEGEF